MSENQFKDLPELPDGWHYETGYLKDLFYVVWDGHGTMALDFRIRAFDVGTVRFSPRAVKYEGRGWKERMVRDAVRQLQKAWE